jgi:tocopherol cyclase
MRTGKLTTSLRTTLTPSMYHGLNKNPPFFEGWYYKLVSADDNHKIAIIPGVILGEDAHTFVQVLDGIDGTVAYHTFLFQQFQADSRRFAIEIGNNSFDDTHISLGIDSPAGQLSGEIQFGPLNPWPVTWISPGIMGWYAWVPRMECYHGVLSFDHSLQGALTLNGKSMDFNDGRGYIEKDWGKAFPAAWVWFQSNHFKGTSACITASVAIIPWVGSSFRGFIVGLWLEGKLYRFATYTGARIETLHIFDDHVDWEVRDHHYRLFLTASRVYGGLLRGPTHLDMGKRVLETLNAVVQVRLETLQGVLIFEGVGAHAGLEVIGDLPRLLQD